VQKLTYHDKASNTKNFKNKIIEEETDRKCWLCKQHEDIIDHIISGCPILARNECLTRHDNVCVHLRCLVYKALGIERTDKWYAHTNQYVKMKTLQCFGIKGYTETEKLKVIGQIDN
jgi:hypothetical protein